MGFPYKRQGSSDHITSTSLTAPASCKVRFHPAKAGWLAHQFKRKIYNRKLLVSDSPPSACPHYCSTEQTQIPNYLLSALIKKLAWWAILLEFFVLSCYEGLAFPDLSSRQQLILMSPSTQQAAQILIYNKTMHSKTTVMGESNTSVCWIHGWSFLRVCMTPSKSSFQQPSA